MNNNSETDIYYKNTMNSNSETKENKMAVIYEMKFNDRIYIGSAFNFEKRKYHHIWHLKRGTHHNKKLQNSFDNSLLHHNFEWRVLEKDIPFDKVYEVEQRYLDELFENNNREDILNISDKARHPRVRGAKHTDEFKQRLSERMTGSKRTDEVKKKMSDLLKERWSNPEYRKKMSEAAKRRPSNRKGVKLSEETKRKISEAKLGTKYKKIKKNENNT